MADAITGEMSTVGGDDRGVIAFKMPDDSEIPADGEMNKIQRKLVVHRVPDGDVSYGIAQTDIPWSGVEEAYVAAYAPVAPAVDPRKVRKRSNGYPRIKVDGG
jgi:hypothetical protein